MKKLLRKCAIAAALLLVLLILSIFVLSMIARRYVSRDALVTMAEGEINSRVQIEEAELSLFRLPARITLREVALAPRDAEISKPPGERTPLEDAPVRVKEVRIAVGLGALIKRRIEVQEFVFEEPRLEVSLSEDGENSLDDLLRSPGAKKQKKKKKDKKDRNKDDLDEDELINSKSLNVYTHGFLGHLENLRLVNGQVDFIIEKTGLIVKVWDLDARLDEIAIDPSALEQTNTARLWVDGELGIDSHKPDGLRYAHLILNGFAEATLFDFVSGNLEPNLLADLEIGEESYLNARIPVVEKAWKALQKLEKIGLQIDELPEKATFGRSKALAVHYQRERFTLRKPISVWFRDWELAVMEGTWIQSEVATHAAGAELVAEEQLSAKLRSQIGKGVEKLPKELRPVLIEEVEATWFRDGRLVAEVVSAGELSDPDVTILNKFPDLGELLKKAAGKVLPGLLERLLRDEKDK